MVKHYTGILVSFLLLNILIGFTQFDLQAAQGSEMIDSASISGGFCDNFNSSVLSSGWSWVDPLGDSSFSLTANPGHLRLYTPDSGHDLYLNLDAPRIIQPIQGDFIVTTKVNINPIFNYQGAGLLIWENQDNYIRLERTLVKGIDLLYRIGGTYNAVEIPFSDSPAYIKIRRQGDNFTAWYSTDNSSWNEITTLNYPAASTLQVGLVLINEWQDNPIWADFDYFELETCPPPPPTLYDISNDDMDGNYEVSWSSVPEADSYELQEEINYSDVWTTIYTGNETSIDITDRPTHLTQEWCYRVRSSNTNGYSNWSLKECTVVDIYIKPDTPTLYPISNPEFDGNYTVGWSDVTVDAYYLEERHNFGAWYEIPYNDRSEFSYIAKNKGEGNWCYRVKAVTSRGSSDWSSEECTLVATSLQPPILDPIWNPDLDGDYSVNWSNVPGADSYELQEENYGGWKSVYTGSSTSYDFVNKPTYDFCYRVRAQNNSGLSDWSAVECVFIKYGVPPDTPTLYPISNPEFDGNFTVIWSDVSADYYRLEEQQNGGNWNLISNYDSDLFYIITNKPDGTWCYKVMAFYGEGSDWSNSECTTVDTKLPNPLKRALILPLIIKK